MKGARFAGYIGAFVAGVILSGTTAFAATTYIHAQKLSSAVALNGKVVANPPRLVYGQTSYVSLYSIEQALKAAGVNASWNGSKNPGVFSITIPQPAANPISKLSFSNVVVQGDGIGDTLVDGIVTNSDTVTHSFTIVVSFYDSNGKLLGLAYGAVNDLAPGSSHPFEAIAGSDYTTAASYKVQVDTLVQ